MSTGEDAGIAKITINRPEVRNAFRPETVIELIDAFDARARGPRGRRRDPHRRGTGRVLLRRRPARPRLPRRLRRRAPTGGRGGGPSGGRALPRHRPAHPDPPHAEAGRGDGRRLRDRRRPRPARRLRSDDRRRQRPLRPDRAEGRLVRRRLRRQRALPPRRAEEGQGDLVPLPPVRRPAGARDGARQHRRAARAPRGGDRAAGAARCSRCPRSRCAC